MPNEATFKYRSSSERDWISPPRVPNSLKNGITRVSRDKYQEMITEISPQQIALLTDFTWRLRGLLGALRYQAPHRDATKWRTEWSITIAKRHTKQNAEQFNQLTTEKPMDILPKLLSEMGKRSGPKTHQSYHPNDYDRYVVHRDPTICRTIGCRKPHMQTGFLSSEAHSYHAEYDYLLWSLGVR